MTVKTAVFSRPVLALLGREPLSELSSLRDLASVLETRGIVSCPFVETTVTAVEPPSADLVLASCLASLAGSVVVPGAERLLLWGSWSEDSIVDSARAVRGGSASAWFSPSSVHARAGALFLPWWSTGLRRAKAEVGRGPNVLICRSGTDVSDLVSRVEAGVRGIGLSVETFEDVLPNREELATVARSSGCIVVVVSQRARDLGDPGALFAEVLRFSGRPVVLVSGFEDVEKTVAWADNSCCAPGKRSSELSPAPAEDAVSRFLSGRASR